MRLTGNEPWVIAGTKHGETIWVRSWGAKDWWWPVVDVELDCGLIGIDVCGKREVWHLDDVAQLRIGNETIVENEDLFAGAKP